MAKKIETTFIVTDIFQNQDEVQRKEILYRKILSLLKKKLQTNDD